MRWARFARAFTYRTKNGRWSFEPGERRLVPEVVATAAERARALLPVDRGDGVEAVAPVAT